MTPLLAFGGSLHGQLVDTDTGNSYRILRVSYGRNPEERCLVADDTAKTAVIDTLFAVIGLTRILAA